MSALAPTPTEELLDYARAALGPALEQEPVDGESVIYLVATMLMAERVAILDGFRKLAAQTDARAIVNKENPMALAVIARNAGGAIRAMADGV